ncbi:MAG: TetR/AcrR family transcriptional regulator [Candidatus Kapaibacterium sp.]
MNKKEHIIETATKLFSENGFDKTSLSSICEKADVSKGLIFHHFKSKDNLLREIFIRTTKMIEEINNVDFENSTPSENLELVLNSYFNQLEADKLDFQLNLNIMIQPTTREILGDLIKVRTSLVLKSVRKIFDEIDIENSEVMSYILIAELDGIALDYLAVFDKYPLKKIRIHIINKYKY